MSLAIVGVSAVVIGAGAAAYSAYAAGKGSGKTLPSPEDQLKDAGRYADAQMDVDKHQAQMALAMYPQFAQAQLNATENVMKKALEYYPQFATAEQTATSAQRTTDLSDFTKNAGGWADTLGSISPAYAEMGNQVSQGAGTPLLNYLNYESFMAGPSDLRNSLTTSAQQQLALGGSLSPEEERAAQQSSRAAWSDRGLVNSNPAVAAEVLARDSASRARLQEREQLAMNVQQLGQSEDSANHSFQTGVQAQNEAAIGNYRNYLVSASQAEINPILQGGMTRTDVNPYGLFGASTAAPSPYGISSVYGSAPQIAQGVQAVQPLYMTDFAAAESRANAQATAIGALGSGVAKTGGSLYASSMIT